MIDPASYAKDNSEESHQIALFIQCSNNLKSYPELQWLFAIPNGGYRSKGEAGRLKAAGVKSGVPDMFLPIKRGKFSGLWIELKLSATDKKKATKTSDEQDRWIDHLQLQGFGAMVCFGYQHAYEMLIAYLEQS